MPLRFRAFHLLLVTVALGSWGCGDDADTGTPNPTDDAAIDASSDTKAESTPGSDAGSSGNMGADASVDANVDIDANGASLVDVSVDGTEGGSEASSEASVDTGGERTDTDGVAAESGGPTGDATPSADAADAPAEATIDANDGAIEAAVDGAAVDATASDAAAPDSALDAQPDGGDATASYPGDTCEDAVVIGPGHYTGQIAVGYTSNYGVSGCVARNGLPDRVYKVPVGIGQRLDAKLTRDGFYNSTLDVVLPPASHCGSACLASSDSVSAPEQLALINRYGVDSFYLIVGTHADPGTYSLDVGVTDTLPGTVCETAVAITPGSLYSQTMVGYFDTYHYPISNCTGYGEFGPERVYSIQVPAGNTLTVTATPSSSWDLGVYLIRGPADTCRTEQECLVGIDSAGNGGAETVTYKNQSQAEETMFVFVDVYDRFSAPSTFTLTTAVAP